MVIPIPEFVHGVLARLEDAGFEAWCVGGCVRDCLLGRAPSDWDVATNALPHETAACFPGHTLIETGKKHGTIGVVTPEGTVEVTTYRVDGAYTGHRRPEQVAFARRLEDDLARRDFTINAMAWHPERGLVDLFGGRADLERSLLRCVGEPARRFDEDALRILRCLRFAAVLGFEVEKATAQAAQEGRALLACVSGERVREELTKLLLGKAPGPVMAAYPDILFAVLPELAPLQGCAQECPYHDADCWQHTLRAVEAAPREAVVRWAALLHDCAKPAGKTFGSDGQAHFYGHAKGSARLAQNILERLRFSNREKEEITGLVLRHGEPLPISEKRLKRLLAALGPEGLQNLLGLIQADVCAQAAAYAKPRLALLEEARALSEDILRRGDCLTLKSLAVGGKDLLALGYQPGRALGLALNELLEEVLSGRLPNEKPALLARAGELLQRTGPSM